MTVTTAIIGGTGFSELKAFSLLTTHALDTPYGPPSADLQVGTLFGQPLAYLPRHGLPHRLPPHQVNYRANLAALSAFGIKKVIGIAAVGGISPPMKPATIAVPDQLIDYSYGRVQTFHEGPGEPVVHIDFTEPYTPSLRKALVRAAADACVPLVDGGVYGCTQGPRLETAAEIRRMERDGCDLVGMTGMPEAALAREAGLDYVCLAVVANWAAGKTAGEISLEEIHGHLDAAMVNVLKILEAWLKSA